MALYTGRTHRLRPGTCKKFICNHPPSHGRMGRNQPRSELGSGQRPLAGLRQAPFYTLSHHCLMSHSTVHPGLPRCGRDPTARYLFTRHHISYKQGVHGSVCIYSSSFLLPTLGFPLCGPPRQRHHDAPISTSPVGIICQRPGDSP